MTETPGPKIRDAIRDDNLRLTFTEQEADFICRKIIDSHRIVWLRVGLATIAAAVLAGFIAMWIYGPPAAIPAETFERYADWIPGATILTACALLIAVFFVICAVLDVMRYRSMQQEHGEFLNGYGRKLPG